MSDSDLTKIAKKINELNGNDLVVVNYIDEYGSSGSTYPTGRQYPIFKVESLEDYNKALSQMTTFGFVKIIHTYTHKQKEYIRVAVVPKELGEFRINFSLENARALIKEKKRDFAASELEAEVDGVEVDDDW